MNSIFETEHVWIFLSGAVMYGIVMAIGKAIYLKYIDPKKESKVLKITIVKN